MVKQKRGGMSGKKGGSIINAEMTSPSTAPKKNPKKKAKKASRGK